jgi:DSF synthase
MAHLQAVRSTLQPQQNSYTQLTTYFDPHSQVAWGYMHAAPRPCFTPTLLRELLDWGNSMTSMIDQPAEMDVKYFVLASKVPDTFSLGGDLSLFMRHITARDRDALYQYAISCIDCSYAVHSHLGRPGVTTIALVQGQALGGGFESALAANVAGKSVQSVSWYGCDDLFGASRRPSQSRENHPQRKTLSG